MTHKRPAKHEGRRRAQVGPPPLPGAYADTAKVSLSEAARYLGVHASTLRRWIGTGKLKTQPGDGGLMIEIQEIARVRGAMDNAAI